jgi:hypothetical protein
MKEGAKIGVRMSKGLVTLAWSNGGGREIARQMNINSAQT